MLTRTGIFREASCAGSAYPDSAPTFREATGAGTDGDYPVSDNRPMFFQFTIAFVRSFMCLATPAWSDYKAGKDAYDRGDYTTALREWRPLAEQGNHSAQYFLGVCYANGYGVPRILKWHCLGIACLPFKAIARTE